MELKPTCSLCHQDLPHEDDVDPKLQDLLNYLKTEGYFNLRVIEDDVIIGCAAMIFTTGVFLNLTRFSYDSRICYNTRDEAVACCNHLQNIDDQPLPGFTAIK